MTKLLTLLLCVASFLMLLMTSCLSQEQRMLKNEVENMDKTLPQEVAGVTFSSITYDTKTDVVTLELVAESGLASLAVSSATSMVKYGLISFLKSSEGNSDLVYAIRKANATLVCPCYDEDDNEIASFTITPADLN
ncbi:MAG: hypothetical protein HDS88_03995 [Bacteroidales bacterium]|nr:hypothetical protein [Bacteroidales bacterium]MBD5192033.1 hypothetical protein [Bacteroidales bacterium]MBD5246064.1 hypothetical protein [Barnesiella sp.]